MFWWYSHVAARWYVLDNNNVVHGYQSSLALRRDYPDAVFCQTEE